MTFEAGAIADLRAAYDRRGVVDTTSRGVVEVKLTKVKNARGAFYFTQRGASRSAAKIEYLC